jgi:penicillin-binding protein 1B
MVFPSNTVRSGQLGAGYPRKHHSLNLRTRAFLRSRLGRVTAIVALALLGVFACVFGYYDVHFGHLIDQRLSGAVFENNSQVYAAPEEIAKGQALARGALTDRLLRAGYSNTTADGPMGWFRAGHDWVEIHPGADSYFHGGKGIRVQFGANSIDGITMLANGSAVESAEIEPLLLTNLFNSSREKRRVLKYDDLPKTLVDAVLSVEDKRFFEHPGFDFVRVFGAAWADIHHGARSQGASTIDMQVARSFFFTNQRTWSRKVAETMMALELEHRFSKREIFELYANEVYLGNRGSFVMRGFGEAAQAYFGKDVRDLNLAQCAFLAGIIHSPNRYSAAERHPQRADEARDRGLNAMVENDAINRAQAAAAREEPLHFVVGADAGTAPYFVDMVRDKLLEDYSETDLTTQSYRIYSTLDPDLQRSAQVAVAEGVKNVDALLAPKYERWRKKGEAVPQVQAALVALDPRTGEIRALVGGRDYGESQLNHILAHRQPGSSFKPFVYAAALNTALGDQQPVVTPVTLLEDEPTTFTFDGKDYTPNNYGEEFYGNVTVRDALTHSMNVATVKLAEMIGYDRVAQMAKQMRLGPRILGTPAVALGAYEMTPLEVAAGYTAFASGGMRAEPIFVTQVASMNGEVLQKSEVERTQVLDPRVAYLTTSLMEDVLNRGTGGSVRRLGFTAPAAGKTGTSRDGWFAGFTSNLICVIWIGFDDNRDLGLAGGVAAAPLWAEFMKLAVALPRYRNPQPFPVPSGIVQVSIDPESGLLAAPGCPEPRNEVFIAGTEPTEYCTLHGGASSESATAPGKPPAGVEPSPVISGRTPAPPLSGEPPSPAKPGETPADSAKKKSIFQKIFGIFGSGNKTPPAPEQPPQPQPNP